jgi:hypothetical protein
MQLYAGALGERAGRPPDYECVSLPKLFRDCTGHECHQLPVAPRYPLHRPLKPPGVERPAMNPKSRRTAETFDGCGYAGYMKPKQVQS